MFYLLMHVMVNGGMLISLLNHEQMENRDVDKWEYHLAKEIAWIECEPISYEWPLGH